MDRCTNCGRELQPEAKFCRFCGAARQEPVLDTNQSVPCPNCGQELLSGVNFCRSCGAPVEAGELVSEPVTTSSSSSESQSREIAAPPQSPFEQMVSSAKRTYSTTKSRLLQKSKSALDTLKTKISGKLDTTILDLENPSKYRNLKPEQRTSLISTVKKIRARIDSGELSDEELQETQLYIRDLNERLKGDKCLVCLKPLIIGDFVVSCPSCNFAGHNQHLTDWIASRGECPLCKSRLQTKDLIHFQLVDNGS
ncbi:MAG: zinc-ribbon domain-containing protein [Candidatus Odinarchaeota archaeon]